MTSAKKSKKKTSKKTPQKAASKRSAGKKVTRKKPATAKKKVAKKTTAKKKAAKKPAAGKKAVKAAKAAKKSATAKQATKKPAAAKQAAGATAPTAPPHKKPRPAPRKKTPQQIERERAQADPLGLATGSKPAALSKLGAKYTCFKCGAKFYDLNRPEPLCPKCGADQREAPKKSFRPRSAEPEATARREARRMAPLLDDDEEVAVVDKEQELDIGLGVVDVADDDLLDDEEDDLEDSEDDT